MGIIHIGMDTDKVEKDFLVLYCTRLQKRIAELEQALNKLIEQASECDGWESFPETYLDEAFKVLEEKTNDSN